MTAATTAASWNRERFAARLGAALEARGWTAPDLAKLIGCAPTTISRARLGRNGMQAATLAAACHHLHISADYLIGVSTSEPTTGPAPAPRDGWLP